MGFSLKRSLGICIPVVGVFIGSLAFYRYKKGLKIERAEKIQKWWRHLMRRRRWYHYIRLLRARQLAALKVQAWYRSILKKRRYTLKRQMLYKLFYMEKKWFEVKRASWAPHLSGYELIFFDLTLGLCNQLHPLSFDCLFPYWTQDSIDVIGKGAFANVYKVGEEREGDPPLVYKLILVHAGRENSENFQAVFNDLLVSILVSKIQDHPFNSCQAFCDLKQVYLLQGSLPNYLRIQDEEEATNPVRSIDDEKIESPGCQKQLVQMWKNCFRPLLKYAAPKFPVVGSELFRQSSSDSLHGKSQKDYEEKTGKLSLDGSDYCLVLKSAYAGKNFWTVQELRPEQALSIYLQVACAFAVAEKVLDFEHRDLHMANVLVEYTIDKSVIFILDGYNYMVPTFGFKVVIIDYSFSRANAENLVVYRDLSGQKSDNRGGHFEAYREMRRFTKHDWEGFYPQTNLVWVDYLLQELLDILIPDYASELKSTHYSFEKQVIQYLQEWKISVVNWDSISEFVNGQLKAFIKEEMIDILECYTRHR